MILTKENYSYDTLNSGYLIGKVSDEVTKYKIGGQDAFLSYVYLPRLAPSRYVDYVPVLFSEEIYSLANSHFGKIRLRMTGRVVNSRGKFPSSMFDQYFEVQSAQKYGQLENYNNSISLQGDLMFMPNEYTLPSGNVLSYFKINVSTPTERNTVLCYARKRQTDVAFDGIKEGDRISLDGRIQSRTFTMKGQTAHSNPVSVGCFREILHRDTNVAFVPQFVGWREQE